jgi:hypothetical protein
MTMSKSERHLPYGIDPLPELRKAQFALCEATQEFLSALEEMPAHELEQLPPPVLVALKPLLEAEAVMSAWAVEARKVVEKVVSEVVDEVYEERTKDDGDDEE